VRGWIVARAREAAAGGSLACLPRHAAALERVGMAVAAAREGLLQGLSPELVAFELREAQAALGELLGERTPEAVLEAIFSRFCIGK
ncbi:MAG: tRNA uridine-5-carboxymethylaminomethyl(34) synthesis GTPase MnmE, partial [Nitrospirae bacterium]